MAALVRARARSRHPRDAAAAHDRRPHDRSARARDGVGRTRGRAGAGGGAGGIGLRARTAAGAAERGARVCLDKLRYSRRILADHARRSVPPGAAWAGAVAVSLATVAWAAWLYRLPT